MLNTELSFNTASADLGVITLDDALNSPSFTVNDASVNQTMTFYFIPYFDQVITSAYYADQINSPVIYDISPAITLKIGSGYECTYVGGMDNLTFPAVASLLFE
jgi:hypothetical protein